MGRFLAGALAALMLAGAGLFFWKAVADAPRAVEQVPPLPRPVTQNEHGPPGAVAPLGFSEPPEASALSREQKRFRRYDRDRNALIDRNEYLASRHRAFVKLDRDRDGRLSFDEYAAAAAEKFAKADTNGNHGLDAREFAATRPVRAVKPRPDCPPNRSQPQSQARSQARMDPDPEASE